MADDIYKSRYTAEQIDAALTIVMSIAGNAGVPVGTGEGSIKIIAMDTDKLSALDGRIPSSAAVYRAVEASRTVSSVNGKTGAVVLTAGDVHALPDNTVIPAVPEKVSAFENDAGYLTEHQDISGKVDKVAGKGLSTHDYDNAAKAKVDAIPEDPKYTDTVYDDAEVKQGLNQLKEEFSGLTREYELIEEITVEDGTTEIRRTAEPDGTPYCFKKVYVRIGVDTGSQRIGVDNQAVRIAINYSWGADQSTYAIGYCAGSSVEIEGFADAGSFISIRMVGRVNPYANASSMEKWSRGIHESNKSIKSVVVGQYGGITAGTVIKIWGVRADA